MTEKIPPDHEYKSEAERQAAKRAERSAAQLRANLQRRKAQTRARREGRADEAEGLPAAGHATQNGSSDRDDKQGG
ncbi:MAG: hypothetical protein KUA43_13545 [Hoeflea sp.]|uniref:hypothetical protein n=1 Tax=Hoeflea sp. TaxID=1940281 RepID=UPI001D3446EC|nr:hypothetical protein [Hoeflea sp.]MBU4531182.1 hypothetical protein [Alphaproteobacteria bacterium]MBU4545756.1 hypothetical protein [Alphaproteobacteria bacterium]MBU4550725.1 hypothetical protein [Alphaproteobacteria bacterium]MBV1724459.1 hypothetical protein [Hoeflea sp.]MBV1760479.1 hypothetical protein [Hoeflea sp.]